MAKTQPAAAFAPVSLSSRYSLANVSLTYSYFGNSQLITNKILTFYRLQFVGKWWKWKETIASITGVTRCLSRVNSPS